MEGRAVSTETSAFPLNVIEGSLPLRHPRLKPPPPPAFISDNDIKQARLLLAEQRHAGGNVYATPPRLQRRFSVLRLRSSAKPAAIKHDVASVFNDLVERRPLPSPGLAQAVLSHSSGSTIDELWHELNENARGPAAVRAPVAGRNPWLGVVVRLANVDYVRLICHVGASQAGRDDALRLAVSRNFVPAIEVLLQYGACPSACKESIRDRFQLDDVRLAELLLAATSAMSVEEWRYCLEPCAARAPSTLLLCLDHRPDLASGYMLLEAMESVNLSAVAIILGNSSANENLRGISVEACRRAHVIKNEEKKYEALAMLARAGLIRDTAFLRVELCDAVQRHRYALVQLLITAGVSLDTSANETFFSMIAGMAFDLLELVVETITPPLLAPALDHVPQTTSEQDILRLLYLFRDHMGEPGAPLHRQLIRAVRAQRIELVRRLLACGAAPSFQKSKAVREAIRMVNLDILQILLDAECSAEILSEIIPTAMALNERVDRHQIMLCILGKGRAPSGTLAEALLRLVTAYGEADMNLTRLLLEQKAPLDRGLDGQNCISVCTQKGDLALLRVLCATGPELETISSAVPIAFRMSLELDYRVALGMMLELLRSGASVTAVNNTLLDAVEHDEQLGFVRALLQYHADANFEAGYVYMAAIEREDDMVIRLLCEACPPARRTLDNALPRALDPQRYHKSTLELLLDSATSEDTAAALNKCWSLQKFENHPHLAALIPCFLKHGLDINVDDGFLLCYAIRENDRALLTCTLAAGPTLATLSAGLNAAAQVPDEEIALKMMDLVLCQARSSEIGQSKLLPRFTHVAVTGRLGGFNILLRHQAKAAFNDGQAVQIAAEAGCLEVLDLLLQSRLAWSPITAACHAVLCSNLPPGTRQAVFKRLLDASIGDLTEDASELLDFSLTQYSECAELPGLLLERGAKPSLATCRSVLDKISVDRYVMLVIHITDEGVATGLFKHIVKTSLHAMTRYRIYKGLLLKGLPGKETSAGLVHYLKTDIVKNLKLIELLLNHGAEVGYDDGTAFRCCHLSVEDFNIFTLLCQHIKDDRTASIAFEAVKAVNPTQDQRLMIYSSLLAEWKIKKPVVQETLLSLLRSDHCDAAILDLLMDRGADPNEDNAQCFTLACNTGNLSHFRALSRRAQLDTVAKALIKYFRVEGEVVRWLNLCLERKPRSIAPQGNGSLFECMRAFHSGTALMKLLLSNGIPASATTLHSITVDWPPEHCTPLIWALCSKPRIDDAVIGAILEYGSESALPAYLTPSSGISAAFLCLLERSRTNILKTLLEADTDRILSSEVSGPSFEHLALASADLTSTDSEFAGQLPLHLAALYLGNFDAFSLLSRNRLPNDGLLHVAAFFALPEFVQWCLRTDDPNATDENFNDRIPLAVACDAQFVPFCKFGNERDFRSRQTETMGILAPRTDLNYREKHKTILHIALHSGPETAGAMLGALGVASDPYKHVRYGYTDQEGRLYSPPEYVREFIDCSSAEKELLFAHLSKAGFAIGRSA